MRIDYDKLSNIIDCIIEKENITLTLQLTKAEAKRSELDEIRTLECTCITIPNGMYSVTFKEKGESFGTQRMTREDIHKELSKYVDINIVEEVTQESNVVELPTKQEPEIQAIKEALSTIPKKTVIDTEEVPEGIMEFNGGCRKCNYTGFIVIDEASGLKVRCSCRLRESQKKKKEATAAPVVAIKNKEKLRSLVPLERRNDEYDSEIVKNRIKEMSANQSCRIYGFESYDNTINTILSEITTSGLKNSYIIGAPNGFGKTTFVYTGIKRILAKGGKAVPYLSLMELAEKKVEYEERLTEKIKNPRFSTPLRRESDDFIWPDFLLADVLFTYMSSAESKWLESSILSGIMAIRGTKNLPTIVMISTSLNLYKDDDKLRKYYWADMLDYGGKLSTIGCDRLIHRSCYKLAENSMRAVRGVDY